MTRSGLIDIHGNPLSSTMGYTGGGVGFGGQMAEWTPPSQSADAALLPTLKTGNARADDLVRNNGLGANIVRTHTVSQRKSTAERGYHDGQTL